MLRCEWFWLWFDDEGGEGAGGGRRGRLVGFWSRTFLALWLGLRGTHGDTLARFGANIFLHNMEVCNGNGVAVEIKFLRFRVVSSKVNGIVFNVCVEDFGKFIVTGRKGYGDFASTKFCISCAEVRDLSSMEEELLPIEGVRGKEFGATEAFDVGVFDGAWVDSREFLHNRDDGRRDILGGIVDRGSIGNDDVGVRHDGANRKGVTGCASLAR